MDWMNQIGGLLKQYQDRDDNDPPPNAEQDFEQVAQHTPPGMLQQGVSQAFRSKNTPPFPNMIGQIFGQADPNQRASILNTLLATAGPALMAGLGSRGAGGAGGGLGSMLGPLGGLLSGQQGQPQVTPEVASQVPPEAVEKLASAAEQQDPSVIDRVSEFAAQNPMMVKALGAVALGIAMKHLGGQKRGGLF